jgi:hypothetical protein
MCISFPNQSYSQKIIEGSCTVHVLTTRIPTVNAQTEDDRLYMVFVNTTENINAGTPYTSNIRVFQCVA